MKPHTPSRHPLDGLNPFDDDGVRTWFQDHLDRVIHLQGQPTASLHLLFDGHREVLDLGRALDRDPDFDPAATYAELVVRPAVRAVVMVAMLVRGDGERAAVAMSQDRYRGEPSTWWAAWRGYEMTQGCIGRFTSDWEHAVGEGVPPEPFGSLVTPSPGATPATVLPGKMPEPDLRAAFIDLDPDARLPTTALEMTELAAASTMPTVVREGLDHARIFRLRGRACEIWEIRGKELPSSIDDLVRYVCQMGEPADAVALVVATVFEEDGEPLEAVQIRAELGDGAADRYFTFRLPPGGTRAVISKTHWQERARDPQRGWLGVDPLVSWELYVKMPSAGGAGDA